MGGGALLLLWAGGTGAQPATPVVLASLTGRNDTATTLTGRNDTAATLIGRNDTVATITGRPG